MIIIPVTYRVHPGTFAWLQEWQ